MVLLFIATGLSITFFLFGFIESLLFTTILRVFAGFFGAPTWLIMITLCGQHFGNDKVSIFTGCASICTGFLILIFLTAQGQVYQSYGSWRATYYILGLLGFVTVIAMIFTMHAQRRKIQKIHPSLNSNTSWVSLLNINSPKSTTDSMEIMISTGYSSTTISNTKSIKN